MTDRQSVLSPKRRSGKPGRSRALHLKALAAGAVLALVATVGVNVQAGGTGTAPTPADLASSYMAAIGTANAALVKADAKLKALSMGATSAQVNAIVAPLGPALKPLQALIASTKTPVTVPSQGTTTTPVPPTTLSSLGKPTIYAVYENTRVPNPNGKCVAYKPAPPTQLNMAGHIYAQGGQFTWTCENDYNAAGYAWPIPKSQTFTAQVGEELGAAPAGVALSFLGNGKPLPFVANGVTVTSLRVPLRSSKPVSVTASLTGTTKLTVVLTQVYTENSALENYTVDFGNAVFTH